MLDTAATGLAWFIICFVPTGGIVLFWMVHVLPEKFAHKRHHPQRDAIQVMSHPQVPSGPKFRGQVNSTQNLTPIIPTKICSFDPGLNQ
jgi:hypothetical protein